MNRYRGKILLSVIGLLVLGGVCFLLFRPGKGDWGDIPTVKVKRGHFEAVLYQIGEVKAVHSTNITPSTWGKLANLIPEGTQVKKDDPVAWVDTEKLESDLKEQKVALEIAEKRLEKVLESARLESRLDALAVQEAESTLEFRRTQLENAENKLKKMQRLVDANLAPAKNLEEAELNKLSEELQLKNAEIALERSENKKRSQEKMMQADIAKAKIDVEKARNEYDNAKSKLDKAVIKAPTSGLVLYKKVWSGGTREKIQIGDQVGPWQPILEIPDLSELQIVTSVDEVDISRLETGMKAEIFLDAYPDLHLTGEITKISTLAQESGQGMGMGHGDAKGGGRKVFEVFIRINAAPKELRPGVSGKVRIILADMEDALVIPIECIDTVDGKKVVYIDTFTGVKRTEIKVGAANYNDICVLEGLREGQDVYLGKPEKK